MKHLSPNGNPPPYSDTVLKILVCLDKLPLSDRSSQNRIAVENGLNAKNFVRLFKDETGMTPKRYFNYRRIEFCRRQLVESDTPVKVIALELGFAHLSDFSCWVKKNFGAPPTSCRRNARAKSNPQLVKI